ncbi:MAG: hypothetical protein KIT84_40835 [Labilithrix sp.]|nr:hypothetical protein [Labilithrix sp.]MCW5817416.1 hypothetical protein [Labilithrix sp.]
MLSLRRTALVALAAAAFGVALAFTPACGTDPVGVESCQKIEKVRCESAPACNIPLRRPVHNGDSAEADVAACIRYYDDQCLHGLALARDPGPQIVDACVNAIINGDCGIVAEPQRYPECAFLAPSDADAAADAEPDTLPTFGDPDATPQ